MQVPRLDEDRGQHGRRRGARSSRRCSTARSPTSRSSPARSRSSPRRRSRSPASSSARATRSAPRSRCAATGCGSSSTGSSALAIPRIRDFRGLDPNSFDGRGNYTFGVTEQLIFPEIDYDKIDTVRGMDITIVTTARTDDEGRRCCRRSASRSAATATGVRTNGQEGTRQQAAAQAEVQGARLHPLPALRPAALGVPQVRALPDLSSASWRTPGRFPGVTKASW